MVTVARDFQDRDGVVVTEEGAGHGKHPMLLIYTVLLVGRKVDVKRLRGEDAGSGLGCCFIAIWWECMCLCRA